MSKSNNGKYIRHTAKRSKNKSMIMVLSGIIVILLVVIGVMLWLVQGQSAYRKMVRDGYTGTQEQLIASLVGEEIAPQEGTAYEMAVQNGYEKTEEDWIRTLTGRMATEENQTPYQVACANGFEGNLTQWLTQIAEAPESLGRSQNGEPTPYEQACEYGFTGTFIEWIVSLLGE